MNQPRTALSAVMLLCLSFSACGSGNKSAIRKQQETAKLKLESLQKLAAQTAQTSKSMTYLRY